MFAKLTINAPPTYYLWPLTHLLQAPSTKAQSQQVYLDLSVDGEPKGRLVIQLTGDAPVGTKRFAQLSQGLNGVGYRLSKFDGIAQVIPSKLPGLPFQVSL